MPPRFFVCVERGDSPLSAAVDAATRFKHGTSPEPWVLPSGPSTHAFVAFEHEPGWAYRLDGLFPRSVLDIDHHQREKDREARWEIIVPPDKWQVVNDCLRHNVGMFYDLTELPLQLVPGWEMFPGVKRAVICTHLVSDILEACGGSPAWLNSTIKDRYPETMARAFADEANSANTGWIRRSY